MAAKKKTRKKVKAIAKSTALDTRIESAVVALVTASDDCSKAVSICSQEVKKLTAEAKRLSKKRATLLKRKKAATKKARTLPGVETRKALSAVVKELAMVSKQVPKARVSKASAAAELSGLKSAAKRVSAYVKSLDKADKVLNKPAKKRRKRKQASSV